MITNILHLDYMKKLKLPTELEFELHRAKTLLPYMDREDLENQLIVIYEHYLYLHHKVKKRNLA